MCKIFLIIHHAKPIHFNAFEIDLFCKVNDYDDSATCAEEYNHSTTIYLFSLFSLFLTMNVWKEERRLHVR